LPAVEIAPKMLYGMPGKIETAGEGTISGLVIVKFVEFAPTPGTQPRTEENC